ncbi:CLIP domain-containing serine protease 14D-like [Anopheles aquasalis]|uniref:CLIP domain-containing serine protease 14D-like n=1 Tax=Anopheles aquasalis TaxID=42839 RepID=UPI00215A1D51|nr:CLIP domain-containing serine protease 14D-like [Anopheles aquasalis]
MFSKVFPVLCCCLSFVASIEATDLLAGDICRINGKIGRCVPFTENAEYQQLFRKRGRTAAEDLHLEKHICDRRQRLTCRLGTVNDELCGIQMDNRIVGGSRAFLDQFPWMALMQYQDHRKGRKLFACGGVLLNRKFVLSAAHCFVRLQAGMEFIKVRIGEWDTQSEIDCEEDGGETYCAPAVQDFGYERLIVHERYTGNYADRANDIALIKLKGTVEYNEYVRPICLPEPTTEDKEKLYIGNVWAAGWGRTETSTGSPYKLVAPLSYYDQKRCDASYRSRVRIPVTETQFCAMGNHGRDTCNGDSGGPLMKWLQTRYYVTGVVSFGPQRCGNEVPAVYTKVDSFFDWIVGHMVLHEDSF